MTTHNNAPTSWSDPLVRAADCITGHHNLLTHDTSSTGTTASRLARLPRTIRLILRPMSLRSWLSNPASGTTKSSACTAASAIASFPAKTCSATTLAAAARPPARTHWAHTTVRRTAAALAPMPAGHLPTSMLTSDCTALAAAEWAATERRPGRRFGSRRRNACI